MKKYQIKNDISVKLLLFAFLLGIIFWVKAPIKAYAETKYDLWIGDTQVTSSNMSDIPSVTAGKATYDPTTNTLTFNNVTAIKGTHKGKIRANCVIYSEIPVKIQGNLKINTTDSKALIIAADNTYLDIEGNLSLTGGRCGIYYNGKNGGLYFGRDHSNPTVTVKSASVAAITGRFGKFEIFESKLNLQGDEYGILAEDCDLYLGEGSIKAKGGTMAIGANHGYKINLASDLTVVYPGSCKLGTVTYGTINYQTFCDSSNAPIYDIELKPVYQHNKGSITFDLSSGKRKLTESEDNYIGGTLYYIRHTTSDPKIDIENKYDGDYYDLDLDGNYDVYERLADSTYYVLKSSSIKGKQFKFSLPSDLISSIAGSSSGSDCYESIAFNFPKNPETIGINPSDLMTSAYDQGEATIDLSKGAYTLSGLEEIAPFYNLYNGCVEKLSIITNEKTLTDIDVDLDKDDTFDINISLILTDKGKFKDMTISALPSGSIKESKALELAEDIKYRYELWGYYYFSKVTFIFTESKAPVKEEEAKKVEDPAPSPTEHKIDEVVADGGSSYKITSVTEGQQSVTYLKPDSNTVTSANIPAAITIDGKEYKVTEIAPGAFKNNKKLKRVTIGANIKKIGAKAFFKCKNLKTVNVKTTSLTKSRVGGSAFKGIHEKAKVKVPKKKLSAYQKIFKARGVNGKSQKITK